MNILETVKAVQVGTNGYKLEFYAKTDGGSIVKVGEMLGSAVDISKDVRVSASSGQRFITFYSGNSLNTGLLFRNADDTLNLGSLSYLPGTGMRFRSSPTGANFQMILSETTGALLLGTNPTDNGTDLLQVNGSCANATGVWATLSDRDVKENIKDVNNSLDKVMKIADCVKQYNYIAETGIEQNLRTQFIAQDLIEAGFEGHVIETNPMNEEVGKLLGWEYEEIEIPAVLDEEGNITEESRTETKVLKEGRKQLSVEQNLTPYLFPAFRDLYNENQKLKERVKIIEEKLGL